MYYTFYDYETLVDNIIKHMQKTEEWWNFFPIEISPFAYNETAAQGFFPMTREEVKNANSKWLFNSDKFKNWNIENWLKTENWKLKINPGWKWKDQEDEIPDVKKIIPAERLPDNIKDIPDDILNWAIKCEISRRPFRIIPQELNFYRENNIPIPHLHPDERQGLRMRHRNPCRLFDRNCDKCKKQVESTYSIDRPDVVYCEECYLGEVY